MDARIDVFRSFGLEPGEAHVIRNAGGVISDDVIRSLAISQRLLETTEVHIVQHTGCGMMRFSDEEFADSIARDVGARPDWSALAFDNLEESLRRQVALVEGSRFLTSTTRVRAFILDLEADALREVKTG